MREGRADLVCHVGDGWFQRSRCGQRGLPSTVQCTCVQGRDVCACRASGAPRRTAGLSPGPAGGRRVRVPSPAPGWHPGDARSAAPLCSPSPPWLCDGGQHVGLDSSTCFFSPYHASYSAWGSGVGARLVFSRPHSRWMKACSREPLTTCGLRGCGLSRVSSPCHVSMAPSSGTGSHPGGWPVGYVNGRGGTQRLDAVSGPAVGPSNTDVQERTKARDPKSREGGGRGLGILQGREYSAGVKR